MRKKGTAWFMQAGGKLERGEDVDIAFRRELEEEIGLSLAPGEVRYLGHLSSPAANEPNCTVEAEVFHVRTRHAPITGSEIEQAVWVSPDEAEAMPLAPLPRHHVLPLLRSVRPQTR